MPESKGVVLVTGAGGFIGSHLVRRLASDGYAVRATCRDAGDPGVPDGVDRLSGDLRDPDFVRQISVGVDLVFHLAAAVHENDPSEESRSRYVSVNVDATRELLKQTAGSRSAFVFASTVAVYGEGGRGAVFDEESPSDPRGFYAKTKLEAEKLVLAEPDGIVLRFPAVFGPGMRGNLPRLADAVRRGFVPLPGDGKNRKSFVHVEDAVTAMTLAAGKEDAKGKIYNVTDGQIYTISEVVEAFARALGTEPRVIRFPAGAARLAAAGLDRLSGLLRKKTDHRVSLDKFLRDSAVNGARIREELGFEPRFRLGEGWER